MIFISILCLIVAIALPSLKTSEACSPIVLTRISSIVFIYAGALSLNAFYIQSIGSGIGIYSGLFQVTTVSQLIDTFLFIMGSLILIAWPPLSPRPAGISGKAQSEGSVGAAGPFASLVLFSTLGGSLLVSSADLISMYLSIELQSFGVYILSTLYRDSESATSAGLKYFLLGGLSSCLILLGAGVIYTYTGLTNFESIYSLGASLPPFPSQLAGVGGEGYLGSSYSLKGAYGLGFIIITVGFLFKIAAAPLHNWAPDVYDDSPTIVTIWLTIMPKLAIIIFILELYNTQAGGEASLLEGSFSLLLPEAAGSHQEPLALGLPLFGSGSIEILKNLLLLSSLISLLIGTLVGLAQSRIKRLLAYSTISHVGFMLLALAINTEQSIDSLIFYILQYSLTNLNVFLILIAFGTLLRSPATRAFAGVVGGEENDIKYISELKGQLFSNPLLSLSLTVCLFSMAGIPPLLGFFSKQFVLYSAIQSGYYFMSIVGILVSVISASYYLKIIKVLHTAPEASATEGGVGSVASSPLAAPLPVGAGVASSLASTSAHWGSEGATGPSNSQSYLISTLTLSILLFILKPSILLNSTQLLSLSLFNY